MTAASSRWTCPATATAAAGITTASTAGRTRCWPSRGPPGITDPPIIIGHSMGGFVALRAAGLFGAGLEGIVVIDSPVQDITPEEQAARESRAFGPLRVYPDTRGRDRAVPPHARSADPALHP